MMRLLIRVRSQGRMLSRGLFCIAALLAFGGCATAPRTPNDPFENFNRGVFSFNEAADRAVLKPAATGYQKVVPELVRGYVDNFFGNIADAWSTVNLALQAKPRSAIEMGARVTFNTVLGLGGILDIASEAGIARRSEDFGQTLGWWGVGAGPYVVLPLLGPSTARDTGGLLLDFRAAPTAYVDGARDRIAVGALQAVNTRAGLLSISRTVDEIAIDKYSLLRDGYLARRRNQVYDGNPPEEPESPQEESEPAPPK